MAFIEIIHKEHARIRTLVHASKYTHAHAPGDASTSPAPAKSTAAWTSGSASGACCAIKKGGRGAGMGWEVELDWKRGANMACRARCTSGEAIGARFCRCQHMSSPASVAACPHMRVHTHTNTSTITITDIQTPKPCTHMHQISEQTKHRISKHIRCGQQN